MVLTAGVTWWLSGSTDYVADYGGVESQYDALLTSTDCAWLGETAARMNDAYERDRNQVSLGYQMAAVDRMVELNCP